MHFTITAASYEKNPMQKYELTNSVTFDSRNFSSIEKCKNSAFTFLRTFHTKGEVCLQSAEDFGVIKAFFHVPPSSLRNACLGYATLNSPDTCYTIDVKGEGASTWDCPIPTTTRKRVTLSEEPIQRAFANSNLSSFHAYYHNTVRKSAS